MSERPTKPEIAEVVAAVVRQPIGYAIEGEEWLPQTAHAEHRYEFTCAVCRAGDHPEALERLVEAVLATQGATAVSCPNCGATDDHEGYPEGSLGAQLRCLRRQAEALGATGLIARMDQFDARLANERDAGIARYLNEGEQG